MITSVQSRNVQKSRSGLTCMCKLTFEDTSGTISAVLWPDEFAKMGAGQERINLLDQGQR